MALSGYELEHCCLHLTIGLLIRTSPYLRKKWQTMLSSLRCHIQLKLRQTKADWSLLVENESPHSRRNMQCIYFLQILTIAGLLSQVFRQLPRAHVHSAVPPNCMLQARPCSPVIYPACIRPERELPNFDHLPSRRLPYSSLEDVPCW